MKVSFDMAARCISIEGDAPDLLEILKSVKELAPKFSEIKLTTGAPAASTAIQRIDPTPGGEKQPPLSLREFARAVAPQNNYERIVAIAAYKQRYENREAFSPKEMGDWFMQCGFERPSQMAVAIFDARRKYGFLDKSGHGQWKLSTGGQNLVIRRIEGTGGAQ